MSKFTEYIGAQFGNPHGFIGKGCCVIMNVINRTMYRSVAAQIQATAVDKILDVGYGNGYLLQLLYQKCKADMYGIDISEDMREQAIRRNKMAAKDNRLHLQVGDCCALPYEDEMFAAVSSVNTIYFWSDTVKGLSEIRRVLKPGKSFYNVVYTKEWLDRLSYTKKGFKKFEPEQMKKMGEQAGFEKIEMKEIVKNKSYVMIYTRLH